LANSSESAELAYVQANVSPLLVGPVKSQATGNSWTSDGNYAAVLVKAGTESWLYVNVVQGQVLSNVGSGYGLSHVSRFVCEEN
jgi:hypothetical protein